MIPQHGWPNRSNAMGMYTLILLGFVLGWIARHCVITMNSAVHGLCHKLQGVKRVELNFSDDEKPKLGE